MNTICVYCGSSEGNHPRYMQAAERLGKTLANNGLNLVYGGASVGLMGAVADSILEHGGKATGVIPDALYQKEVAHTGLSKLHVVKDMHERKSMMAELCDGFITLPGGLGTLEELFETVTWAQLGFHRKPIGLLNIDGYFDSLITFIDQTIEHGFVKADNRHLLTIADSSNAMVRAMREWRPAEQ